MYAFTPTLTHKTFFYAVRKFYFDWKRRRETIIAKRGVSTLRIARV